MITFSVLGGEQGTHSTAYLWTSEHSLQELALACRCGYPWIQTQTWVTVKEPLPAEPSPSCLKYYKSERRERERGKEGRKKESLVLLQDEFEQ